MVQELIEKGTLQGSLEDFEAASYFIDSVSSCRSNVRINMVADLMNLAESAQPVNMGL